MAFRQQMSLAKNMIEYANHYQQLCYKHGIIQPERLSEKASKKKANLKKSFAKISEYTRGCDSLNSENKKNR